MKTKLNIELFKKVRARIAEIPESYNQSTWVRNSSQAPCGTVACLAGEAIICNAPTVEEGVAELRRLDEREGSVAETAAELLGLPGGRDYFTANDDTIFDEGADGWPEPYYTQLHEADTPKERAEAAVAFLDHVIATGRLTE